MVADKACRCSAGSRFEPGATSALTPPRSLLAQLDQLSPLAQRQVLEEVAAYTLSAMEIEQYLALVEFSDPRLLARLRHWASAGERGDSQDA